MVQKLTSELQLKLTQQVSGPAAEARKALSSVDQAMAAIGKRREADQRLAAMAAASEKARAKVRDLQTAMVSAEKVTKRQADAYQAATLAADKAAQKLKAQQAAVAAAERGMRTFVGATESMSAAEARLRQEAERAGQTLLKETANAAKAARLRRSLAAEMVRAANDEATANRRLSQSYHERRAAALAVLGSGAMWAGSKAGELVKSTVGRGLTLDQAQRQQVAFGNISEQAQKAVLRPQADRIAQATRFGIPDVLSGQTNILESLPSNFEGDLRAQIAQAITANAVNYALAIPGNIDMSEAGHRVISYLKTMNKDISTPEKAAAESSRAVNMMIKAAKLSGAKDNDIAEFMRFGGAPGTFAGFSDPFKFAILAAQKRAGSDGALTGTFLRALAGYSVAPTKTGLAALADIGIRYDDYTTMKGGATSENFSRGLMQRYGIKLSPDQKARVQAALDGTFTDETGTEVPILSDRGKFTEAVQPIVEESFSKGKNGKVRATDSAKVKKDIDAYYNDTIGAVDVERLFRDMVKRDPSMGVLNAFLGKEQGGRFIALLQQMKYFEHDVESLSSVPPDFAQKIGEYLMGGVYGSQQNAEGSFETAMTRIAEAWSGKLQFAFDRIGEVGDAISGMSENARVAAGALLALGSAATFAGGAYALYKGGSALLGIGGGAAAGAGAAGLAGSWGRAASSGLRGGLVNGLLYYGGTTAIDSLLGVTPEKAAQFDEDFSTWSIMKRLYNDVTGGSSAPGIQYPGPAAPGVGAAAPAGEKSGSDLGGGIADGLGKQSSLIEDQARQILAAVQQVMSQGVEVPVRIDSSGAQAAASAARAQADAKVSAMLRSTYADTEFG